MQTSTFLAASALTVRGLCAQDYLVSKNIFAQSVRWKRKPIWLPPAKSKMFRVPPRRPYPEEEKNEFDRLDRRYKTYYRSIRYYLADFKKYQESQESEEIQQEKWNAEFRECLAVNDKWNKQIAARREERLAKEKQELEERVKVTRELKERKKAEELAKAEEEVAAMLAQVDSFITEKNIDQAIDEALETVVDYNYCINQQGKKIKGIINQETIAQQKEEKQAQ